MTAGSLLMMDAGCTVKPKPAGLELDPVCSRVAAGRGSEERSEERSDGLGLEMELMPASGLPVYLTRDG